MREISFSGVPSNRSRALSIFVAVASADAPPSSRIAIQWQKWAAPAVVLLAAFALWAPVAFLVVAGGGALCLWLAWMGRVPNRLLTPEQRFDAVRAKVLRRLNRERAAVGLDDVLNPQIVAALESCATVWKRSTTPSQRSSGTARST